MTLRIAFIFMLSFLVIHPAHAERELGGRLKERIKDRIVERMEDKAAPAATASVTDPITRAGDYYFTVRLAQLDRHYRVHVPRNYRPTRATPLVLAFHGGGGDMDYMARDEYYGLISKADREGFIIVFPNGYSKFKSGKFATWNAGNCCGDARDLEVDDVGFVRTIVKNLTHQMNIDPTKIFATGMSNGGMISHRLACEAADIFSAVAPVAGTDNTVQCNPSKPVSVLIIHAKNDDHVLFNGGAGAGAFKDESKVTDFTSVPETLTRWLKRNRCDATPERVLNIKGAYCYLYSHCADETQVKLCVTDTGGHSWPGGKKPRGEAPSTAISANDQLWTFFTEVTGQGR